MITGKGSTGPATEELKDSYSILGSSGRVPRNGEEEGQEGWGQPRGTVTKRQNNLLPPLARKNKKKEE